MRARRFARLEHEERRAGDGTVPPSAMENKTFARLEGFWPWWVRRARKEVTAESLRLWQGVRRVREFWGRDEGAPVDYVAHVPRESSCLSALPLRSAAEINHSRTQRIVRESSGQGATDFEPSIRRHNTPRAIIGNHRWLNAIIWLSVFGDRRRWKSRSFDIWSDKVAAHDRCNDR